MIIKKKSFSSILVGAFLLCVSGNFYAYANTNESEDDVSTTKVEQNKLEQDIESLQDEILQLNRDLFILEEDLLFPASTQVAIFVSVDIGRFFTLDSVELKIDGQDVAGFLYTTRQRVALEQGGIQQVYKGNIKTGEHQVTAIFTGLDNEKRTVKRAASYTFEKYEDAVMIELKIIDSNSSLQASVVVEEWVL